MSVPIIAGLYPYTRGGVSRTPRVTLREIPESLEVNPSYRENLLGLAGDQTSAEQLSPTFIQRALRTADLFPRNPRGFENDPRYGLHKSGLRDRTCHRVERRHRIFFGVVSGKQIERLLARE